MDLYNSLFTQAILLKNYGWKSFKCNYDGKKCDICWNDLKDSYVLQTECDHVYHKECILKNIIEWNRQQCPTCKTPFILKN